MTEVQATIGTLPTVAVISELVTSRNGDLAFEIHNGSKCELELVAIEQDVRAEDDSLLERRMVDVNMRMAPGDRRTVLNPISRFGNRIPLVSLVYTFAFRAPWGGPFYLPVRVASV
jgi:hypothetical protein